MQGNGNEKVLFTACTGEKIGGERRKRTWRVCISALRVAWGEGEGGDVAGKVFIWYFWAAKKSIH
jgi:hypothetical protein